MRKLPYILSTFALLVAIAGPVAAKVITVTNPMKADLDGGGYVIENISRINTDWLVANQKVSVNGSSLLGGGPDPSLGLDAPAGSLYLRRAADAQSVAHGELWLKTGIYPTDWIKVAG